MTGPGRLNQDEGKTSGATRREILGWSGKIKTRPKTRSEKAGEITKAGGFMDLVESNTAGGGKKKPLIKNI